MSKLSKKRSIETLKSRYGLMFISPWIIGMVLFVVFPILQSAFFSFANIGIEADGIKVNFVGNKNFYEILVKDKTQFLWITQVCVFRAQQENNKEKI